MSDLLVNVLERLSVMEIVCSEIFVTGILCFWCVNLKCKRTSWDFVDISRE